MSKEKFNTFTQEHGIAIPIIQRDYVQGANVNFEKRDNFIQGLLDALVTGEPYEMDFLYGSTGNRHGHTYFLPVDGQQRLTTVSLIGWVLNQRCGKKYSKDLVRLTYNTRPSSEQFCEELLGYDLPEGVDIISEHLKSVPGWFSQDWLFDPSVKAMLELIDKVDATLGILKYKGKLDDMAKNFFADSPITFESLDMKALHLNDDLYIKMNARGKLLTPFENWKAEFEGHLAKKFPHVIYKYGRIPGIDEDVTLLEYFEYAIEHDWTDLLWPVAYKRWDDLKPEEKKKVTYPRVDELFMSFLDYVARFIFYASLSNVDQELAKLNEEEHTDFKEVRMLYEYKQDSTRMTVFNNLENVNLLFRILDLTVKLAKTTGSLDNLFNSLFIRTESKQRLGTYKVNFYNESVHLLTRAFDNKLNFLSEIMLWAVIKWLLNHPDQMEKEEENLGEMQDFLRIIMGWCRERNQRSKEKLTVSGNIRLQDFYKANHIINTLAESADVFSTLKTMSDTNITNSEEDGEDSKTKDTLAKEKEKAKYYGTPKFDIIRELSTSRELYYNFSVLLPSIDAISDSQVQAYIERFYEFSCFGLKDDEINLVENDEKRIRELNQHGFNGIIPFTNHYFYGYHGRWDYLFTMDSSDGANLHRFTNPFTAWMLSQPQISMNKNEMSYYINKYPEFLKARNNHQSPGNPFHYFWHKPQDQFEVTALKTFSSRPTTGYNVNPYAFTVEQRKGEEFNLWAGANGDHPDFEGLWIGEGLYIECLEKGWIIYLQNRRFKEVKKFLSRFEEITDPGTGEVAYVDTENEFQFDGQVLLDLPNKDRIETAELFLETLK